VKRRTFIAGLGSAAAWPLVARTQERERVRRVGILLSAIAEDDPEGRMPAFVRRLAELGWTEGRNLRVDYRYGLADPDRLRRYALELVALSPDVLLAGSNRALAALQEATHILPIVFANVVDPVGAGFVASLAHPGGNATGFMIFEFGLSTKWLELLKQIAPRVRRVGVLRAPDLGVAIGQFAAMQALAPSLGIEVTPLEVRGAGDIERAITGFAQAADVGLIVTLGRVANSADVQGPSIVALAARHRLPTVYSARGSVVRGGLISYGPDQVDPYRQAAGYVDRILKGEKPADLPVQQITKIDLVINLRTAKALGLTIPETLLATADEVIQ